MSWHVTRAAEPPASWRALVETRGTFYHDPRWVSGVAQFFRFRLHCLTAAQAERAIGLLALAEVPGLVGPRRLVSFPFSYAAGPLTLETSAAAALYEAALELTRERRLRRVEIKRVAGEGVHPSFTTVGRYHTYHVPTDGGGEAVWARLHESTTRSIRKAEREGVVVRQGGDAGDWHAMALLEEETAARHGLPAPPRRFFTDLCRRLQDDGLCTVYLATVPTRRAPIAGIVCWTGGRSWIHAFGASQAAALGHRPNHALLWQAMQDAVVRGVAFDLGRAAPEQEGLVQFKTRWGGQPIPLAYDYWPSPRGLNTLPRDRGPLARAARWWSALPTWITRRASGLYRYLG